MTVRVRPSGRGDIIDSEAVRRFRYPSHIILGSDQDKCFSIFGEELLERMRGGYNTTVLAYGQTGSGKTYTMFGPTGCVFSSHLSVYAAIHSICIIMYSCIEQCSCHCQCSAAHP